MKKYTSDYTTKELIKMGYIDELIIPLVNELDNFGLKTNGSCEGHINNYGNCEYPWIDICLDDLDKLINLLSDYKDRPEILIQFRNDQSLIDKELTIRIFPYCENLIDGQEKFNKFYYYLKNK